MEKNELNVNARGGTELMGKRIDDMIHPDFKERVQIIHSRVRELDESRVPILVLHDLAQDPEVQHLRNGGWKNFGKLVFVSHWQQQEYNTRLGVPFEAGVVLRNAISPIREHAKPKDKLRIMYYSTPHRGLNIAYAAFDELYKEYGDLIEFNVFSSFDLYGWEKRDEPFKPLFDALKNHPGVNYSKSVPNETIREELTRSHIFAYPSIWQETSCLCLIEAMSANLTCVHSSLGALPETSMGLTNMYPYTESVQDHLDRFYMNLKDSIESYYSNSDKLIIPYSNRPVKSLVDQVYCIGSRAFQWNLMLEDVLTNTR